MYRNGQVKLQAAKQADARPRVWASSARQLVKDGSKSSLGKHCLRASRARELSERRR